MVNEVARGGAARQVTVRKDKVTIEEKKQEVKQAVVGQRLALGPDGQPIYSQKPQEQQAPAQPKAEKAKATQAAEPKAAEPKAEEPKADEADKADKAAQEAKAKAEEEAKAKAAEEKAKAEAEAEARKKAETAAVKAKSEADAKKKAAEGEAKKKAETETKAKIEAETKKKTIPDEPYKGQAFMPGYFEILKNADKRYEAEKAVTSAKTVQGQISMPLEKSKLPLRDINTLPSNPAEKYICVYDCAFNGTYDEVAKHEQNCSLREENNKESVTVKPNNLFPSESLFACEKGCGFTGTFQAVAAHEKTCQYGIAMYTGRKSGMSGPVTQSGATTPRLGSAVRVGSNVQGENGVHRLQSAAPVVSVPTQFLRAPTHGPFPVVPPGGVMQTLPMYGQPMITVPSSNRPYQPPMMFAPGNPAAYRR
mmetsp:Transcript_14762/g.22976  ORF Transcript_14762/g.22976 Transcript_14762/m.22976 type:complete len:422 (-) Transcript_14762:147-1412(-)